MKKRTVYFEGWGHVKVTLRSKIVREVFTEGHCGALAKALNHITGCKMIMSDRHVAVITFDGRILDIEGVHDPTAFEEEWNETEPCNVRDIEGCGVDHWHKAIPFAQLLVKKYLR